MKYDLTKKTTRGAQRTLDAFSATMFTLIAEKEFDNITVNEICEHSNYPRATFYNYFDDKFDLLDYSWYVLSKKIHLDEFQVVEPENLIPTYFDRVYDLFVEEKAFLNSILIHNGYNGTLIKSFIEYIKKIIGDILYECIVRDSELIDQNIPLELLADHFTNTIILILDWAFLRKRSNEKPEALYYLNSLLQNY